MNYFNSYRFFIKILKGVQLLSHLSNRVILSMYQNNLLSISDGALAPITMTTNLITSSLPLSFRGRKFKKLGTLFQPGGMNQLVHAITSGKNKKKLLASFLVKDDGTTVIKKSFKKGKKRSNKSHRYVSTSSIHHIKNGKKGAGFDKFIKDKLKKDKKKKWGYGSRSTSASRISKKLRKDKKRIISTTPVSKQNVSGKKVNKKMDKIKNKTSNSNSKAFKRMNKKGRRDSRKVDTKKVPYKNIPPSVISKVVLDIKEQTGEEPSKSKVRRILRSILESRTSLKSSSHKRVFSKKNKLLRKIINNTLDDPKISHKLYRISPQDREDRIKAKYHNIEDQINEFGKDNRTFRKQILRRIPKKNIDNLKAPSKKWWTSIL